MLQIHEKIKNERIKQHLTEDEVAERCGVSRSTYQYWEKKTPGIEKVKRAAKALGLPDDYFFVIKDETNAPPPSTSDATQQTITLDASVILELLNESRKEKAAMIEVINKNLTQLQKSSNYTNSGIDDVKLLLKDIVIRQLDALLSKPEILNPEEVQVQLSEQKGSGNVRGGKKFRKKEMGSTH